MKLQFLITQQFIELSEWTGLKQYLHTRKKWLSYEFKQIHIIKKSKLLGKLKTGHRFQPLDFLGIEFFYTKKLYIFVIILCKIQESELDCECPNSFLGEY